MRTFLILILLLTFFAIPLPVRADVAPPAMPPGSNPQPGAETTQVRMMAETVSLDILSAAPKESLGRAKVTASFTMRNLGDKAEQMAVRFPLGADYSVTYDSNITDMQVKVDGIKVVLREITGEDPYFGGGSVPWIEFDAAFAPGKDVTIQVSYTLEAGGESPYALFSYVFSTGAGWNGTIGSATLFVRFPYEVNEMNVLPSIRADEPNLVIDHKISPTELKWTWAELEPQQGDNFEIRVVVPSLWQNALELERQLTTVSWDGEAWGRLGKLYKSFTFDSRGKGFRFGNYTTDKGAQDLFHRSVEAYEKALRYKELDAQWHAGFADLLIYYAHFAGFEGVNAMPQMIRGLEEMHTALHLAPQDPKVLEVAEQIVWYADEGMVTKGSVYDFPWLTATPVPTATLIGWDIGTVTPETPTPQVTVTPQIVPTRVKTLEPTRAPDKKPINVCGSALFIPLLLGLVVITKKK